MLLPVPDVRCATTAICDEIPAHPAPFRFYPLNCFLYRCFYSFHKSSERIKINFPGRRGASPSGFESPNTFAGFAFSFSFFDFSAFTDKNPLSQLFVYLSILFLPNYGIHLNIIDVFLFSINFSTFSFVLIRLILQK